MKIITKDFLAAIAPLVKIAGKRTTLPVLNCLYIYAGGGFITVTATNLDVWQRTAIECDASSGLEPFCINANRLAGCLRGSESVDMELSGTALIVKGQGWSQRIPVLPAKDFPEQPDLTGTAVGLSLTDLADAIAGVAWAASDERLLVDSQIYRQTILIVGEPKALTALAVMDLGHGFIVFNRPLICADAVFHLPHIGADSTEAALRKSDASLVNSEKRLVVTHKDGYVSVQHLQAQWPDARNLINAERTQWGTVDRDVLLAALRRCSLLFPMKFGRTQFISADGCLSLVAEEKGETANENVPLTDGKPGKLSADCCRMTWVMEHLNPGPVKISSTERTIAFEQGDLAVHLQRLGA